MIVHEVRVHPSAARLPREAQLTWKIAELAAAAPPPEAAVADMVACRVVDNAGVALAAINRQPVATARVMALAHPRPHGATLFGLPAAIRVQAEWACWANATAVRELDFHDCVSPGAHPGDNIAPLIAVAQQMGCDGAALVRAIAVAYEVQVALVKGMPLAPHPEGTDRAFVPGHDGRPGGAAGVARLDDLSRPESGRAAGVLATPDAHG